MSFSFPEANPEQIAAAHAVIERVVATDPTTIENRDGLLSAIHGVSDAIGTMVVGYGIIPPLQMYEDAHFYGDEQESVYVLRQPLGRTGLMGSQRFFCAFRPTTRGAYMAVYDRLSEATRIRRDVLLPDEIDTERLRNYSAASYETDGHAAVAREFRMINRFSRVAMPGAPEVSDESQRYFKILQGLSGQLLASVNNPQRT